MGAVLAEWLVRRFGFGRTFLGSAVAIGMAMLSVPLAHGSVAVCSTFLIAAQLGDQDGRRSHQIVFWGVSIPRCTCSSAAFCRWAFIGAIGVLLSTMWLVFSPVRRLRELPQAVKEIGA